VLAFVWNPEGTRLVSGGGLEGNLRLWDPARAREINRVRDPGKNTKALAWSPDGTRLAVAGAKVPVLRLYHYDAALETLVVTNDCPEVADKGIESLAWSPDGKVLAAIGGGFFMLDPLTGRRQWGIRDCAGACVTWSPDGRQLATAGADSVTRIWDARTGREIRALLGHAAPVSSVTWSPDGSQLATGSQDKTVKIWNVGNGLEVCSFQRSDAVTCVGWSPDGLRLAAGDLGGDIYLYDSSPGRAAAMATNAPNFVKKPYRLEEELIARGDFNALSELVGQLADSPHPALRDPPAVVLIAGRALATRKETSGHGNRDVTSLRLTLTLVLQRLGNENEAEVIGRDILEHEDASTLNDLAWRLATSRDPNKRDGHLAVRFAEQAVAATGRTNAMILDTLAAAYAEVADFPKAIGVQEEALARLGPEDNKKGYESRLRLYQSGSPVRE